MSDRISGNLSGQRDRAAEPPAMDGDQSLLPLGAPAPPPMEKALPLLVRIRKPDASTSSAPRLSIPSVEARSAAPLGPLSAGAATVRTPSQASTAVGGSVKRTKYTLMEIVTPTVGLMTLAGCLTYLIVPQEAPMDPRIAAALSPSRLPTIVIDAGHGGRDDGAKSNGLVEKQLTLDLANRLDQRLQTFGFKTVMTRRNDIYIALPDRADMANQVDHSLFVSLHFNNSSNTSASGIETYFASQKVPPEPSVSFAGFFAKPDPSPAADTGENFAGYVQASLLNRTDAGNRGIKGQALYVVRHTRAPAILVEGGFLSNPFEARLIATPEYRERLAGAIAEGVAEYAKTMPPPPKPPTQLAKAR